MSLFSAYTLDLSIVPVLADMEEAGVRLDMASLATAASTVALQQAAIMGWIRQTYGWDGNLRSTRQKQQLLFEIAGLKSRKRTKGGQRSTDKEALGELASELAQRVIEWNELDTLRTNFVEKLPKLVLADGRIHANFNQAGGHEDSGDERNAPSTGRLSSSNPNLQNIPVRTEIGKVIRSAFVPQDGWWLVKADLAQEEARLLALLSDCKRLLRQFEAGDDPYLPMTQQLFPDVAITKDRRFTAKTVFLAKQYGAGWPKVWEICLKQKMPITKAHAQRVDAWFDEQYPEITLYVDKCWQKVISLGYVESWFGRKRWIPKALVGDRQQREAAKREATNMPVQGTGADVMKMVLRRVWEQLQGMRSRLVLTVHDEVVVETHPEEVAQVREMCAGATEGLLPIVLPVEVGQPAIYWS